MKINEAGKIEEGRVEESVEEIKVTMISYLGLKKKKIRRYLCTL